MKSIQGRGCVSTLIMPGLQWAVPQDISTLMRSLNTNNEMICSQVSPSPSIHLSQSWSHKVCHSPEIKYMQTCNLHMREKLANQCTLSDWLVLKGFGKEIVPVDFDRAVNFAPQRGDSLTHAQVCGFLHGILVF